MTSVWIFLWDFHLRSWQCCQLTHFLLFLSRVEEEAAPKRHLPAEASFIAAATSIATGQIVTKKSHYNREEDCHLVQTPEGFRTIVRKNGCENFSRSTKRLLKSLKSGFKRLFSAVLDIFYYYYSTNYPAAAFLRS